ncbi:MAG: hypothetical protein AB7F31_02615 [Parachlamydiales bacterium]
MRANLSLFFVASLALHIGLATFFARGERGRPPPKAIPNKAVVHTVYLKPERPTRVAAPQQAVAKVEPKPAAKVEPKPTAKVEAKPKPAVAKAAPKKGPPPVAKAKEKVDTPKPPLSQDYAQEIAMQLKLLLSLPEYGEVTVMLRLGSKGEVAHIEIVESQSKVNERYLLEMLPKITLPAPPSGEIPLKLTLSNA